MTNYKLFDCQRMFRHACAFADCADLALSEFDPRNDDVEWYTTPATVNSAFACEVFLKTLMKYYDIPFEKLLPVKDRHKIKELYELLPEDSKNWIKATVTDRYGVWTDGFGRELLESISNAFVDWRYNYEHGEGKRCTLNNYILFLRDFRNTLREACCWSFFGKTWEEYKR